MSTLSRDESGKNLVLGNVSKGKQTIPEFVNVQSVSDNVVRTLNNSEFNKKLQLGTIIGGAEVVSIDRDLGYSPSPLGIVRTMEVTLRLEGHGDRRERRVYLNEQDEIYKINGWDICSHVVFPSEVNIAFVQLIRKIDRFIISTGRVIVRDTGGALLEVRYKYEKDGIDQPLIDCRQELAKVWDDNGKLIENKEGKVNTIGLKSSHFFSK